MRPKPKMLDRLARILRSSQQQRITPRRRPECQLIKRQTLASSLLDASARGGGEVESGDCEFWNCEQTGVVGNSADDNEGALGGLHFFGGAAAGEHGEAGEGEGGTVDAGHEEAAEDYFVEVGVGTTYREGLVLEELVYKWAR